jgi:hypothetical protein
MAQPTAISTAGVRQVAIFSGAVAVDIEQCSGQGLRRPRRDGSA